MVLDGFGTTLDMEMPGSYCFYPFCGGRCMYVRILYIYIITFIYLSIYLI